MFVEEECVTIPVMRSLSLALVLTFSLCLFGCSKANSPEPAESGASGVTAAGPDVGPVTPVTGTSLDDASGGGVNSAAMKKAKGIAAQGVGSVNNAERQGDGPGDD